MPFRLFAFDYDETVATEGRIQRSTEAALAAAREAGWRLALVTGRPHEELVGICPQMPLFDLVVDENGGLVHLPATGSVEELVARPNGGFRAGLTSRSVPFVAGRIVTITRRSHEKDVFDIIAEQGLDLDVFCNRFAVMVVPRGTSKASGLREGLRRVGVAPEDVIAAGDDENDLAFFEVAGLRVAVANAIANVKANADIVLSKPNGEGLAEFIRERLIGAPESLPRPR